MTSADAILPYVLSAGALAVAVCAFFRAEPWAAIALAMSAVALWPTQKKKSRR